MASGNLAGCVSLLSRSNISDNKLFLKYSWKVGVLRLTTITTVFNSTDHNGIAR